MSIKRFLVGAVCAPVLALLSLAGAAQVPQPPEVAARSWLVMDVSANQVLAAKDIDTPVEQASLTKLMTAYVVFDALRAKKLELRQALPVSVRAWKTPGSRMFLDPRMQVPVEDLLKGMIVQSGNDATVALAESVGGTVEHFVELMNQQAKALGMKNTTYKNPEGLPEPGHTTTARDLSVLATRLIQEFPEYLGYSAIRKYRYEGTPPTNDLNRNLLLARDPTVDGMKTGHAEAAGYCLIASAKRDFPNLPGRRMLAIVLGASSDVARANEAQKLLNWGYTAWEGIKLFDAGQAVAQPPVWKGSEKTVKLGQAGTPIVRGGPAGTAGRVKTQVARSDPLIAPFAKGQQVAVLRISSGEQVLREVPLVALASVEQAGVLRRAWDAVRLWVK